MQCGIRCSPVSATWQGILATSDPRMASCSCNADSAIYSYADDDDCSHLECLLAVSNALAKAETPNLQIQEPQNGGVEPCKG